jgi:hypothetical protein
MLGLVTEDDQDGKTTADSSTESIGGKPKLDDDRFNSFKKAISEGFHNDIELSIKKYSLTFTQKEVLNSLINDKKLQAFKKSIK